MGKQQVRNLEPPGKEKGCLPWALGAPCTDNQPEPLHSELVRNMLSVGRKFKREISVEAFGILAAWT